MAKKKAALHQDIRKVLNDKQRLWFDSHPPKFGKKGNAGKMNHNKQRKIEIEEEIKN